jgi:hypothetical protein
MLTRGIRGFVTRDWASARRAKDEYWAARIAELGAAEGRASPTTSGAKHGCWIQAGLPTNSGPRTWMPTFASPSGSDVPVPPAAVELLAALSEVLQRWGFNLRIDDGVRSPDASHAVRPPRDWHARSRRLAGSGLEDEFLSRARTVDLGGVSVPVIDREDLIIAKILAGRSKDIEDVTALWRAHAPDLDASRIERVLRLLEEALAQSDLVSAFETIRRP